LLQYSQENLTQAISERAPAAEPRQLQCALCGIRKANDSGLCQTCFCTELGRAGRKYTITDQIREELRVAYCGKRTEVSAKLLKLSARTAIPTWALKNEANKNGWFCCSQRRPWTAEEEELLREKAGTVSLHSIAKRLGRTRASVECRAYQLDLSLRLSEGYTLSDLAAVFGVSAGRVKRWAERGLLGRAHPHGSAVRFTESNVIRFVRNYPREYSLARIDQTWFAGIMFGSLAGYGERV